MPYFMKSGPLRIIRGGPLSLDMPGGIGYNRHSKTEGRRVGWSPW